MKSESRLGKSFEKHEFSQNADHAVAALYFSRTPEWYGFPKEGLDWLKEKGCEWVKVNAEAGDLIVWDSRAPVSYATQHDELTCARAHTF